MIFFDITDKKQALKFIFSVNQVGKYSSRWIFLSGVFSAKEICANTLCGIFFFFFPIVSCKTVMHNLLLIDNTLFYQKFFFPVNPIIIEIFPGKASVTYKIKHKTLEQKISCIFKCYKHFKMHDISFLYSSYIIAQVQGVS